MPQLFIKYMVCPRCVQSVRQLLLYLDIAHTHIELGSVDLVQELSPTQTTALAEGLTKLGFELLNDREQQVVNQIKSLLIERVHYQTTPSPLTLSQWLSQQLHKDYSSLSKLFSKTTGITIEHYLILQKIERAKELLSYDERSISAIALQLGYSSTAHLSNQFKKITGMSPSKFKQLQSKPRQFLDDL